jgi:hypothetical protein
MSGVRSYSFREGDRSEYLAQFLLSGIGLCVSIPRQEDIGLDFSCNIADQEQGILSFGSSFMVSVKSLSGPTIELPAKEHRKDQKHIEWLFRQDIPLFLGVVDKNRVSIRLYSLEPLRFLFYEGGLMQCGSLTIRPRFNPEETQDVTRPKQLDELQFWPRMFHYEADLGHPVAIITIESLKDQPTLRKVKDNLRRAVHFARLNLIYSELRIPFFFWFHKTKPDASSFDVAWFCRPMPADVELQQKMMALVTPSLTSLAMYYKSVGKLEKLAALRPVLADFPQDAFPNEIRDRLPELFS